MNIYQFMNTQSAAQRKITKRFSICGVKGSIQGLTDRTSIQISQPNPFTTALRSDISLKEDENNFILSFITSKIHDPRLILHKRFLISHSNWYKRKFDVLMILLTVYSVISSLFFLAFKDLTGPAYDFDQLVWALFVVDFVLNFFTDYKNRKGENIENFIMIAKRYWKGMMIPDFLALIPIRFLGQPNGEFIIRLLRTLKIGRVWRLVNIYGLSELLAGFVYKEECVDKKRFKTKVLMCWKIAKQMISIFFATYFLACIWYYYVDYLIRSNRVSSDFILNFGLDKDPDYTRILKTWYFIFTTLSTVGYGDFYATNIYEMSFDIILLLAGSTWFAFTMGSAIRIINSLQDLSGVSNKNTSLQLWISMIEFSAKPLPSKLKEKIFYHFQNHWKYDRLENIFNSSTEENFSLTHTNDKIFADLPLYIQKKVLDYIFSDVFYSFTVFFTSFRPVKYEICRLLQPRVYNPGEKILRKKLVQEIFFKMSGTIQVTRTKNKEIISKAQISNRCIIGDYYVIKDIQSNLKYSALTNVKGFSIPTFAFEEICKLNTECVHKYMSYIQQIYDEFYGFMNEDIGKSLEYVEGNLSNISFNEKEESEFVDLSNNDYEKGCMLKKEIDRFGGMMKRHCEDRRRLLASMKEKFTNLVAIQISEKRRAEDCE